jgi:aminoglycoside phosphotransferase (APT) family kinase protein
MARLSWIALPEEVRSAIGAALQGPVTSVDEKAGGFTRSMAASCTLADGRLVFVKAASRDESPVSAAMMQREVDVANALGERFPGPDLLTVLESGSWLATIFEHVPGEMPFIPWRQDELAAALHALHHLSSVVLEEGVLENLSDHYADAFGGWDRIASSDLRNHVDEWIVANLDRLIELEAHWSKAAAGSSLVHGDLRSDNMIRKPDGDITFVDWSDACRGVGWFDLLAMLPSAQLEGAGKAESIFCSSELGRIADQHHVNVVLAAVAGFFVSRSLLPPPAEAPTVRDFQRVQGEVAVSWLRERIG